MEINKTKHYSLFTSRIALHIYYWVVILSAEIYLDLDTMDIHDATFRMLINLPLNIVPVYVTLYLILPQVMDRKNILNAILMFIGLMAGTIAYTYLGVYEKMHLTMGVPFTPWPFSKKLLTLAYYNIAGPAIPLAIKIGRKWYFDQKEKSKLIVETSEAKLHLLRAQVNPHFLFNSLNNIASLAHISADKTQESIIMLSELMRYMVYEGNSEEVILRDELNYIANYISLQRIRIDQKEFVEKSESGEFNNHTIAPMLLIPFVENAFKYCDKQSSPGIWINIEMEGDKFNFKIINTINKHMYRERSSSGFGINNVKNRLSLVYHDKYSLQVGEDSDLYRVNLQISLTKNEKNNLYSS